MKAVVTIFSGMNYLIPLVFRKNRFTYLMRCRISCRMSAGKWTLSSLKKGGIDLMIVGIGMNGHIGFNEPGVSFDNYSHVIDLDDTTLSVGQKYFKSKVSLQKGITLGLKHLQESKKVLLLANGKKKAEVIRRTVEGDLTNSFPASIMQKHAHGIVMIDEEAASSLTQHK